MFDLLPDNLKSLAVRSKVKCANDHPITTHYVSSVYRYMPHPYVWMATAQSNSTGTLSTFCQPGSHIKLSGLGLESDGKEVALNELPPWEESKIKVFPVACQLD
jgi:hypothetical protein